MLRLFGSGGLVILISAIMALVTGSPFFKAFTLIAGASVLGLYVFLRRSSPHRTGTLRLPGLREQVDVYADDRGVRHIYANNQHDLYMAQGYITAQDRLWTMDLHRRVASGRLAEVFGPKMLDLDKHFRTVGMHRAAVSSVPLHTREACEVLEAYAEGVNARLAERRPPLEYTLLRCRPEPWTASDCLLLGKYAAYCVAGNWDRELFRTKLTQVVGAEKAAELFMLPPHDDLLHLLETTPLPDVDNLLDIAAATLQETSGSNGWVAGGIKTRSGAPILSNDPHMMTGNPAVWYQIHLVGPNGLDVTGTTFPGVPGVMLGHNRDIAWGATNLNVDCQDLFVEQANPANGYEFRFGDHWEKAERIVEVIRVRGSDHPVQHEVLISRHGPIIAREEGSALALSWPALQPSSDLDTFLAINRARSWSDFRNALTSLGAPAQQFLFAGKDGTIAGKVAGKIPLRSRGDGQTPLAGWTGQCEWAGYLPFEELPELVNPAEGFITSVDFQGELGEGWLPPYRTLRIADRLRSAADLTVLKTQSLQMDTVNYHAQSLLQILLNAIQEGLRQGPHPESLNDKEKRAMVLLSEWDCSEGADTPAPLLWHQWYLFLVEGIFRPQMGLDLFDRFVASGLPVQVTDRLLHHAALGGSSLWVEAEGENSISRIALRAFRRAVGYVSAKYGSSPERWRWGKEHTVTFRHPLSSHRKWLQSILDLGPFALSGSEISLNRPGYSQLRPFQVSVAATWRQIADLGQLEESRDVCAPGQSGHPLSPHYADQLAGWLKGETHVQMTRHKAIQALPCLRLKP